MFLLNPAQPGLVAAAAVIICSTRTAQPLALPVTNHTLFINTSLCCLINRSFELLPQLGGCRPFPRSESSIKGIRILVAEQVRHLCDIDIRPVEILARQFPARLQKQLTKSRPVVVDPPLQGPIAQ